MRLFAAAPRPLGIHFRSLQSPEQSQDLQCFGLKTKPKWEVWGGGGGEIAMGNVCDLGPSGLRAGRGCMFRAQAGF